MRHGTKRGGGALAIGFLLTRTLCSILVEAQRPATPRRRHGSPEPDGAPRVRLNGWARRARAVQELLLLARAGCAWLAAIRPDQVRNLQR